MVGDSREKGENGRTGEREDRQIIMEHKNCEKKKWSKCRQQREGRPLQGG